ncbi:MAG: hypothetical protein AAF804_15035, partial [Bacteroidota bacterium]
MNYLLPRLVLLMLGLGCLVWFGCGTVSLSAPEEVLIGEPTQSPPPLGYQTWAPSSAGLDNWSVEEANQWQGGPGAPLVSEWSHADVALQLEFRLDEQGLAELKLMDFYTIRLGA